MRLSSIERSPCAARARGDLFQGVENRMFPQLGATPPDAKIVAAQWQRIDEGWRVLDEMNAGMKAAGHA